MFRTCFAALVATATAKKCYEAIGTLGIDEGDIDITMSICWPKTDDNGALATGKGFYDDGSAKGQAITITQAWVVADSVLSIWGKVKIGKATNLASIMCELDERVFAQATSPPNPTLSALSAFNLHLNEYEIANLYLYNE